MSERIPYSEMKEILANLPELTEGKQININHDSCPAGRDTKKRLYIKKISTGCMFYCHNCSGTGILRTDGYKYGAHKGVYVPMSYAEEEVSASALPYRVVVTYFTPAKSEVSSWPLEAKLWWYSFEMTDDDARAYGVWWWPEAIRLMLPVGNTIAGKLITTETIKSAPRYKEYTDNKTACVLIGNKYRDMLYIVEDPVSAYKLNKTGVSVMCLFGTSATAYEIVEATKYKQVAVWLDNDVAGKVHSPDIVKKLKPFSKVTVIDREQAKEINFPVLEKLVKDLYV